MTEKRTQRRLAAIISADIVGYSKMMGKDEEGTLARLKKLRAEFIYPKIAEYGGRIVKTMGDGSLVEFGSAVDAVSHAIDVQRGLAERNSQLPENEQIHVRFGINVGDIIIDEDDIYGDGVNIAARLEAMAETDGICISSRVYDHVRSREDVDFNYLGECKLKNIAEPQRVYQIRLDQASKTQSSSFTKTKKPSIAVLPFDNLSGDPDQEYFADGIVEEIINSLYRCGWLFVSARNSSFTYKGKAVDVRQIGRELGVRYVLEGSVQKAKNRVRVACQLIETESGNHLWSERFDRSLDDIFELQDDLTLNVVGAIEPTMRDIEVARVKRQRPDSLDAYDLVLRALPHLSVTPMPESSRIAMPLLEKALTLEPDYASALGFLAWCREILYLREGYKLEDRNAAIKYAQAAIANGKDDSLALTLGAFVLAMLGEDREFAFEVFNRAENLTPHSMLTLGLGATSFAYDGDAERAIEWADRALHVSPIGQMTYLSHHAISMANLLQGQYENAAQAGRRAVQASPNFSMCHFALLAPLVKLGNMEEAKSTVNRLSELAPSFSGEKFCTGFDVQPELAHMLTDAWNKALEA